MKRQLTEEQKAKALARRETFRGLIKSVAAMTDEERARMTNQIGAIVTCEGRTLSLTNTLLLILQRSNVSMVGGFRQWLKAGRCVMAGEHGAMIWFPRGKGKSVDEAADANAGREIDAGDAHSDVRFLIGTVFDVSQTSPVAIGGDQ